MTRCDGLIILLWCMGLLGGAFMIRTVMQGVSGNPLLAYGAAVVYVGAVVSGPMVIRAMRKRYERWASKQTMTKYREQ